MGLLVYSCRGLGARCLDQAERRRPIEVEPVRRVAHAVAVLYLAVARVGPRDAARGGCLEVVSVHVEAHDAPPIAGPGYPLTRSARALPPWPGPVGLAANRHRSPSSLAFSRWQGRPRPHRQPARSRVPPVVADHSFGLLPRAQLAGANRQVARTRRTPTAVPGDPRPVEVVRPAPAYTGCRISEFLAIT
jgi:hypothetical protein